MSDQRTDTLQILHTTDAKVWAAEWLNAYLKLKPMNGQDMVEWMITWFANAIETGRTAGESASSKRINELESGYAEAIQEIKDWATYASGYFQEKHDLAGELAKHRAILDQREQSDE